MRRIDGVQVARSYVMVDYDVPAEALDAATALTPGLELLQCRRCPRTAGMPCELWCRVQ
ncbi:ATP phosphoribosyltransferase [Cutibacterium acnes JCM 18909]|nr:ATP phosphoribosyltransferase [Cutibacterium acnes JCM 18909]